MSPQKGHAAAGSLVLSIASCIVYSVMSNVMVLTNRYLLGKKYYGFDEKFFVVAVQAGVAVLVLELAKMQKLISYDPYDSQIARKWAPVTFFFVAMLYTGMQATAGLPIHIVTVFKNVTNIIIVVGEWRFFGERVGGLVILSLCVMLMGAFMSSYSDVGGKAPTPSTITGYFWMVLNCAATAGYVLYMRGVLGVGLNLASFWCVSATSATTYATVGGLNKIPTTFIGVMLLGESLKPDTAIYVTFGMIGGILYGYAKFKEGEAAKKRKAAQEALPQTTHDSKA
ncbi:hypothetical protein BBO99_00005496 [Phytophthora kernoviae]|uniref:EamA domain-containing protein n=2 Tax=Phytophthora kernoviae TaxID=325452 RepID=A0A3R7GCC4_9STRA|nr:hypothetical protein G195_009761 [Phytophthora kernoviae 00238/432]KAG2511610.1 hypothetical protein JM16_008218 [Phytophthora kernoviae]KAG2515361.1 hypothetical protein JM18_008180 [Phytophthora kernoviae]RLN46040.1 hypothetical protein BBI17_005583 [Phytophthora kernoviae]RLN79122.1 hypothetical protein BBO99_00005496 [Phytophthora kernoviae]